MYTKPFLKISEQIDLLNSRGMTVEDVEKAKEYLHRIGCYRLSAYWHPMRLRCKETGKALDDFAQGTTFRQATDLYTFDGRLRLILLDALERLEVSFRTEVALSLGKRAPDAHRKLSNFGPEFSRTDGSRGPTKHREWLARLDKKALRSSDKFAEHFRSKYPSDDMPIWIAVELLDFGPLSHLIGGMKNTDLASIGRNYGGVKPTQLKSWARSLAFTRNVCVHHSRLWTKPLVNQPSLTPNSLPEPLQHLNRPPAANGLPLASTRLYSIASIAKYMLSFANPRTSWKERFVTHIGTFPKTPHLDLSAAGFPPDWHTTELWKS